MRHCISYDDGQKGHHCDAETQARGGKTEILNRLQKLLSIWSLAPPRASASHEAHVDWRDKVPVAGADVQSTIHTPYSAKVCSC
jgi:hypothetical protein